MLTIKQVSLGHLGLGYSQILFIKINGYSTSFTDFPSGTFRLFVTQPLFSLSFSATAEIYHIVDPIFMCMDALSLRACEKASPVWAEYIRERSVWQRLIRRKHAEAPLLTSLNQWEIPPQEEQEEATRGQRLLAKHREVGWASISLVSITKPDL